MPIFCIGGVSKTGLCARPVMPVKKSLMTGVHKFHLSFFGQKYISFFLKIVLYICTCTIQLRKLTTQHQLLNITFYISSIFCIHKIGTSIAVKSCKMNKTEKITVHPGLVEDANLCVKRARARICYFLYRVVSKMPFCCIGVSNMPFFCVGGSQKCHFFVQGVNFFV